MAVWLCGGFAEGREYTFQAEASAGQDYNTNIFLTQEPHEDIWGGNAGLNANFSAAEEIWNLTGNTRFQNYYYSDPNLDTDNIFLTLNGNYSQNERTRWGLRGNYTRDSTRTSVTEVNDLVFQQVERESRSINPSWTYSLDEKTSLNLDYQFQILEYEKTGNSPFPDSQVHTGTAGVQHQYDDRLQLTSAFSYTRYTIPGSAASTASGALQTLESVSEETQIDYASLVVGFNYAVDESLKVGLSGGGQYNMTEAGSRTLLRDFLGNELSRSEQDVSTATPTWLLSANASKRFERSEIGFDFSKSSAPNLYGNLIDDTRYSLNARYRLTPFWDGSARVSYSERGTGQANSTALIHNYGAQAGLDWNPDGNWRLNASYQYAMRTVDTADEQPDSHAVFLTVRYLWDKVQF